jgi:transposase
MARRPPSPIKPPPPIKPGRGRPKAELNEAEVARLAFSGASHRDIAMMMGVHHKTIANRFKKVIDLERAKRRMMIRQMQLKAAAGGAVAMLIWLGKVELDQTEQQVEKQADVEVEIVIGTQDCHPKPDSPAV